MFSKKANQDLVNPPKRKGAELMNQMGFGVPTNMEDMEAMVYGDDDDDDDLEAELAALTGEETQPKKSSPNKKGAGPVHISVIEQMVAQGMEDEDDVSDTEDPDLLLELAELEDDDQEQVAASTQRSSVPSSSTQKSPPTLTATIPQPAVRSSQTGASPSHSPSAAGGDIVNLLQDRMNMYQQAFQCAKQSNDISKQRRLDRGLKTLTEMLSKAKAGRPVSEEDIPPPVAFGAATDGTPSSSASTPSPTNATSSSVVDSAQIPVSTRPVVQPVTPLPGPSNTSSHDHNTRHTLQTRKEQYKNAALAAKRGGDIPTAAKYAKITKQFDTVLEAFDEGQPVDLSNMPPPLSGVSGAASQSVNWRPPEVSVQRSAVQGAGKKGGPQSSEDALELPPEPTEEEAKKLFQAPDAPKTVMEALTQRLEKYKSSESSAREAGDSGKARRMGRIVKQYESAIKTYSTGKPVDFEELPTPPGFGPIPVASGPPPRTASSPQVPQPAGAVSAAVSARPAVSPPQPAPKPQVPVTQKTPEPAVSSAALKARNASTRKSGHSRQEQQLGFLRERIEEFKTAALQAKKNGDLELAKQHFRMVKGLEPMIEALESGLPVNLAQVPPSPLANEDNEDKYVVVTAEDCEPTGDREELFSQLQKDLLKQIQTCVTNTQHFTKLGDVPAAAKFQKMEQGCRKDLESVKSAYRHGDPVPKFHYETRSFSVVQCNTELGDGEMELTIIRGISYNLPSGYSEKDMDTMVKYELLFPSETPQTGQTATVKDSINPAFRACNDVSAEYGETFKLQIDRKSRSFARVVERKGIKLDVYIKRGFFKGDKLLGSATVKLTPLEAKCILHDSFDLTEGRKSVGGKLEVKVRVRDPFKGRQVEESKEKWLVIDQFIRTAGSKSQAGQASGVQVQKNKKQAVVTEVYRKIPSEGSKVQAKSQSASSEGATCMEVLRYEKQLLDKQISYLKDSLSAIQTQTLRHKSSLLAEKLELQQKQLREGGQEAWKAYISVVENEAQSFESEARQLTRIGDVQKAEIMINKHKLAKKELAAIKNKIAV